jgi:hypothetical protein
MPRSSETVAALASALAKAQAELVNPEKSLTATIRWWCSQLGLANSESSPHGIWIQSAD